MPASDSQAPFTCRCSRNFQNASGNVFTPLNIHCMHSYTTAIIFFLKICLLNNMHAISDKGGLEDSVSN